MKIGGMHLYAPWNRHVRAARSPAADQPGPVAVVAAPAWRADGGSVPPRQSLKSLVRAAMPYVGPKLPAALPRASAPQRVTKQPAGSVVAGVRLSSHAPVRSLTLEEFGQAIGTLRASLNGWEPQTSETADWHRRLYATITMTDFLFGPGVEKRTNIGYFVGDQPCGLMSFGRREGASKRARNLWLHSFVSHPGTKGAGSALLEP